MSADHTPRESAAALEAAIEGARGSFTQLSETSSQLPLRPGGWCARETIGHLIDSACNNHRRFIVGRSPDVTQFDGYAQDDWVERQHYRDESWQRLVALWTAYNLHLAHVMRHTSDESAECAALAPDGSARVTIRFLMEDYVTHLLHHVHQILAFAQHQPRS